MFATRRCKPGAHRTLLKVHRHYTIIYSKQSKGLVKRFLFNVKKHVSFMTQLFSYLIPLLNLIQGPRSDETKRQICFLVNIFHYSDDTTILFHWLSVEKQLFLRTLVSRIDCCEFSNYRFRLDQLLATRLGE